MTNIGSATFSLDIAHEADAVVVRVRGEFDGTTSPGLRQALYDLIDDDDSRSYWLDLGAMTFIDSSGLSALLGIFRRARERGGDVALVNPRRSTLRVIEIAGLTGLVTIVHEHDSRGAGGS